MSTSTYYELYRRSTLGATLMDSLDTLISDGRIEASLAMTILETFDRVISDSLRDKTASKLTFKGHLDTYRFCDDVWTFIVKDCLVKLDGQDQQTELKCDKLHIVACNAKKNTE